METKYNYSNGKKQLDFLQCHSLRGLIGMVNQHNEKYPTSPILRDDVVDILKEEDTFILLYYK